MRRSLAIAVAVVLATLSGCATGGHVSIERDWQNEAYAGGKVKRVLVVVLSTDPAMREDLEGAFVRALVSRDVRGVESHTIIPDLQHVSIDSIRSVVEREGFDAVLVTRGLGMANSGAHTNASDWFVRSEITTYNTFYQSWGETSAGVFTMGTPPAGMSQHYTFGVESTLYETREGMPVWSALASLTTSRRSGEALQDYAGAILRLLDRRGVI